MEPGFKENNQDFMVSVLERDGDVPGQGSSRKGERSGQGGTQPFQVVESTAHGD